MDTTSEFDADPWDGYTAEGLLSQCQRFEEWLSGDYFTNVRPPDWKPWPTSPG
ncbi:hypothetical protein AB0H76_26245 [Nocardia sp. NPDC050712]|uniref:hypothetical protein n=1 Tax=Nocardia sp. NPDC050712 TaxID=3155518 RepID=UPI00340447F3